MGDRGNIKIAYNDDSTVYFYSHWDGSGLFETLKEALKRGRCRWDDEPYLSRIIFSEMIRNDLSGCTGYGISTYLTDNSYNIFSINAKDKIVYMEKESGGIINQWYFEDFIGLERDPRIDSE